MTGWPSFGRMVAAALDRGEDPAMLFDENSPIRDELRRLLSVDDDDPVACAEEVLDAFAAHLPMKETSFDCIGSYITAVMDAATANPPQAWLAKFIVDGDRTDREREAAKLLLAAPIEAEAQKATDFPAGAIINGRTHAERLETTGFECDGGNLLICSDWVEFRRCFEHLADYVSTMQPAGEAQKAVAWKPTESQILEAAEKAGLWPNTIHHWIGAFDRFFDALALAAPTSSASTKAVAQLSQLEIDQTVEDWFAEEWAQKKAHGLLGDYTRALAKKNGWRLGGVGHG